MSAKIDLNRFKEVVGQLKTTQKHLQSLMSRETLQDARRYAENSKQEIQKLLKGADLKTVKARIAKEAVELRKLQQSIPGELARFTKFVEAQKKELEKILKSVTALDAVKTPKVTPVKEAPAKGGSAKPPVAKKSTPRKPAVIKTKAKAVKAKSAPAGASAAKAAENLAENSVETNSGDESQDSLFKS